MMSHQLISRSLAGARLDARWHLPGKMANIWLGADEVDFSHGSLSSSREFADVLKPCQVFQWLLCFAFHLSDHSNATKKFCSCEHNPSATRAALLRARDAVPREGKSQSSCRRNCWGFISTNGVSCRCAVEGSLPAFSLCWGWLLSWVMGASWGFQEGRAAPV